MPKASVKRLIDNRKDKLIDFVLDIEKYPEFIPFCDNSKVYERSDDGDTINIIADLTIGKGPFKDTFKSDVKLNKKNDHIHVVNLGGTKEKPVGLVFIGIKKDKTLLIKENKFKSKSRNSIQKSTVRTVIKIISKII